MDHCPLQPLFLPGQTGITFDPDSLLVRDDRRAQVLLVGSFHFDYPGHDGHETAESDKIDVKSGQRAAGVRELLDYLARFRPDKIYQLAFPLGKRFGLERLIAGDSTAATVITWNSMPTRMPMPWRSGRTPAICAFTARSNGRRSPGIASSSSSVPDT